MTSDRYADELRVAVAGLLAFAAGEESMLLADVAGRDDVGDAECWAALPTIAHTSEFRREQVQRLTAIRNGGTPPSFPRIEHRSAEVYQRYSEPEAPAVWELSRATNAALVDELTRCSGEDLLDPSRHPWLGGRHLWLQVVVRGFWHPTGHLGEYYLRHGRATRAEALHTHAVATAEYLAVPPMAAGMAHYSLACTQAVRGQNDDAVASLARAVAGNPDLRGHANRDPDLAELRASGRLDGVLT